MSINAQVVHDSVLLEPNNINQSFYSLEDGEMTNVSSLTWDLAFSTDLFGTTIRNNSGAGTVVYLYPNGDTTDWMTVDTAGIGSWSPANNSSEKWEVGAFNQNLTGDPFDQGWGVYSLATHQIVGDSLYVVKDIEGDYHKLWIDRVADGKFYIKFADLDHTNEVEAEVVKADGAGKNFLYYSLATETTLDREPAASSWELLFTKYGEQLGPTFYPVTGVLTNNNVFVREARSTHTDDAAYEDFAVNTDTTINEIGYDWKTFNGMAYDIQDSLSYFILDQNENIWHLIMTGFGGSTTGWSYFSKEKIETASISKNENATQFAIYPNPANEVVHVLFQSQNNIQVQIVSLDGKMVYQQVITQKGMINHEINVNDFPSGIYSIVVSDGTAYKTEKLIVQ